MKVTVIGVGNIGGAIARGLAKGSILKASDITCTDLVQENLDKMLQANNSFIISKNNLEAVKNADIVIIAVKPWNPSMRFQLLLMKYLICQKSSRI